MKSIEKHKHRLKNQCMIAGNFISLPFQAVKKSFCSLLITVLGLLLLAGSFSLAVPAAAADISVTVTGDGVTNSITFTLEDLQKMPQVKACLYSTINTWPSKNWYIAEGPKLIDILQKAEIKDEAKLITVESSDGYKMTFTRKELLGDTRYYYPKLMESGGGDGGGHLPGSPEGAVPVDAILALQSAESDKPKYMNDLNAPLLVFGQRWVTEQTNHAFAKHVSEIIVSTENPEKWPNPTAEPAVGTVQAGTLVELKSTFNDADKVYYTTDSTDPTYKSPMYNWVASRWWGSREDDVEKINKPIELTRDTTIKAITIGIGREDSDIATFAYQVPLDPAPVLVADTTNNTVGQEVYLSFTDDQSWRDAIREISVDGMVLEPEQYSKDTPGKITINSDVFSAAGEYPIVIKALGYTDASVMQEMVASVILTDPTKDQVFTRGEQVIIKGTVDGTSTCLKVQVTGPDGNNVYGPLDIEVAEGKFDTSFTLSSSATTGTYTITLYGDSVPCVITSTFTVKVGSGGPGVDPNGDPILTITGNGVSKEVKLNLAQLQAMKPYQHVYSAINTWPTKKWYVGEGVKLRDLLNLAGMKGNARLIKFTAEDGFTATVTVKELLNDTRYYFPKFKSGADGDGHVPGSSSGRQAVEPMVAWLSAEGTSDSNYMNDLNSLLLMMGQRAVTEQNGQLFIKNLSKIEVRTDNPPKWDTPRAEPGSGQVPEGTLVKLSNANMDDDKIHYTTDGSTPTIGSPMYNWIANRWWSSRADVLDTINHPIELKQDTTIKAITIGPGKTDSDIATFTYKVTKVPTNKTEKIPPGKDNTITLGNEVKLDIPANALQETGDVEIKIDKVVEPPAIPEGLNLVSGVYEFSVNGKSNYSFAKNVTLRLRITPGTIGEGEVPAIHYYDEDLGEWINIGGTVAGDTITVEIDHFTKFAVMAIAKTKVEEPVEPEAEDKVVNLTDITGHWAQKNIEQLVASGAVGGYPDGTFKPDNTITRAEFVTILVKAFKPENKGGKTFNDTVSHWAKDYISCAVANGIVTGYDTNTFGPDDLVTREQMAVMIYKAAKLSPAAEETQFTDSGSISGWAKEAIATATRNGIMKGYPDNTIQPQGSATRAEAVTVIVNALNKTGESDRKDK
jgi:hypothetical protein